MARGTPRALWGVTPILTLPLKARATRHLGFRSESVVFQTYHITRRFDLNLRKVVGAVGKLAPSALPAFYQVLLGIAILRYDVFHYFADRGIVPPKSRFGVDLDELAALKAAGKRVYLFHYGADVRLHQRTLDAFGEPNACTGCEHPGRYCLCDDATGGPALLAAHRLATASVSMGDMLAYVPGAINAPYWPIDVAALPPRPPQNLHSPLRILHAPNHTHFKGTTDIEAAIDRLKAEGYAIDYMRISGLSNDEVMARFAEADLIVDQVIAGMHGYTSVEAMAQAKPVIAYLKGPEMVLDPAACPIINARHDTIFDALLWAANHRAALTAIGEQGRRYAEQWLTVEAVAARLAAVYLATADWPEPVTDRLRAAIATEAKRRSAIQNVEDWTHPFPADGATTG